MQQTGWKYFKRNLPIYIMLIIPMAYVAIFSYAPMAGLVLAFKKYNIFQGIWESPWVGFQYFKEAFAAKEFRTALVNTLVLNLGSLIICFPFPIILAILLNEMSRSHSKLKELTQTVLYLPHFLSTVIVVSLSSAATNCSVGSEYFFLQATSEQSIITASNAADMRIKRVFLRFFIFLSFRAKNYFTLVTCTSSWL